MIAFTCVNAKVASEVATGGKSAFAGGTDMLFLAIGGA